MTTDAGMAGVLAACSTDRRLWVFDSSREIALPVPLTSFYAELMRVQQIRDPKVALDPHRFDPRLSSITDRHLAEAFFQYNKLKPKLAGAGHRFSPPSKKSILRFVRYFVEQSPS
ncbi:MAG: hypothetical protein IH628_08410 [Proteobacteria bacterium]|nr:hypothetical protein [Pseudomonadota bacterium]